MSIFNKNKIKDFFIYGIGQLINIGSPLFVMPFIIAKCGQDNFGKVGVGLSLAMILNGFIDYGSYINGVKEISVNRVNIKHLELKFNAIYLSKLILLVAVLSFITVLIFFIPFLAKDKTLYFLSLFVVLGQFINPIWFFQGVENFKWISIVNFISKGIYLGLVFLFVQTKADYIYANFYFGIGAIIGNFIGFYWLIKKYRFSIKFALQPAVDILKYEFSFSVSQSFLSLYQFFPIILVSYVAGDFMAGQFRVIDQIITLFKTYLNMFFYFVYANVCFELDKSLQNGLKIWKQYNLSNFILLFAVVSIFYWKTDLILHYFKIEESQLSFLTFNFRFALLVPLLIACSQPLRQLIFAFNENKIYIKITIISTIINFGLICFLLKYNGLIGVFISTIIIELIIITLYLIILKQHFTTNTKTA